MKDEIIIDSNNLRLKHKSAKVIKNFFLNCKSRKRTSSGVTRSVQNLMNKISRRNSRIAKTDLWKYTSSMQKAKESYETMIENEKLGDVCIVEKCFIFIGTNPKEQSLMLCALKQLVHLDRMVSHR